MTDEEKRALTTVLALHIETHGNNWLECGDLFSEEPCSFDDCTLAQYKGLVLAGM